MSERRATYRLQLTPSFTFSDAAGLADHISRLGVSHVHCSPIFEARSGSPHGYDVVDPTRVRAELGGRSGFEALCRELRGSGLRVLLDIVPNHMAAWHENPWWWSVLERGEESPYAHYFDIDWHPPQTDLDGKVLLPFLGRPLDRALERGEVLLEDAGDGPVVVSGSFRFPVAEGTAPGGIEPGAGARERSAMMELLSRQHYVLADWRRGVVDLNYRRFANVSGLVGMRVEEADVFEALHGLVFELLDEGLIDGLRIDHVDGLRDPVGYFERLRARAPDAWIVVEKVLTGDERLRADWPVEGTTGYDVLTHIERLFVDEEGEADLSRLYEEFTGSAGAYPELELEKKLLVLDRLFASELGRLTDMVVTAADAHGGPANASFLSEALRALVASFPVYRAYVRPDEGTATREDAAVLDDALGRAAQLRPGLPRDVWVFLRDLFLLRYRDPNDRDAVARFQQLTGPVMAKGVEDTAFYCYNRLTCLNEVGGDPGRFSESTDAFHAWCSDLVAARPHTLSVVTTHDTKRSADVRARIALLAGVPTAWGESVRRWSRRNEPHRTDGMPDRNDEYLIYQTLVGAWPVDVERLRAFAQKAAHEAKRKTAWTRRDDDYDRALDRFVEGILGDGAFIEELERFLLPLDAVSKAASVSRTLVQMTAAGPPQIYRGDEVWYRALVDPDNRRPVDFVPVRRAVERAGYPEPNDAGAERGTSEWLRALARDAPGVSKARAVRAALTARRDCPSAFGPGSEHIALAVGGPKARHVVAFERRSRMGDGAAPAASVVTVVPRHLAGFSGDWRGTTVALPPGRYEDVFTGAAFEGTVRVEDLLADFPVALLTLRRCDQ
ncbi:MAG: malto-oligosyltrehalose synthase [Candidatus Eisenbacteria bacterium]|nr:malto-oligosyltrehalose synthase [Candidatus Eisenbacteria bacterium]